MMQQRLSGILLHPTSLPGRYGIGDLGKHAYQFVDFLAEARQSLWQILPVGPTSFGNSPYQCISAFAGNPLLISPERLCEAGYINGHVLTEAPQFPEERVDYTKVESWKEGVLREAFEGFQTKADEEDWRSFWRFCDAEKDWLEDFACFVALKEAHGGKSWADWPPELKSRDPHALGEWKKDFSKKIQFHQFVQYQFFTQWRQIKEYANSREVQIIGDIPIFVAYDSSEVWARPDLFELDEQGRQTVVAGVPPDYFSATGQRWGNPLYRWNRMAENGYKWWLARLKSLYQAVDIVRIDHFRGFDQYWEIPASEDTAINGKWVDGPGMHFFQVMEEQLGKLPVIAEDLGVITPGVEKLLADSGFPGMKVLHFAFFEGDGNPYLPFCYEKNSVVYTGTHDNNTTRGWFDEISTEDRKRVRQYVGSNVTRTTVSQDLMRLAWASTSNTAIAPLQDVFSLGAEARMNLPASVRNNWKWRYKQEMITPESIEWLRELTYVYQRVRK
ncbi:MAG: 4-alpha-glucanotransferase [SAR324 cluster bacterium]|nr:4-alpha-glucanotransferase [SAR324 cluster bacterium]